MPVADVYAKTNAGRAEIGSRQHKLTPAVRSLLLLINGQHDITQLRRFSAALHAPTDAVEQLAKLGLIAPTSAAASARVPAATPALSAAAAPAELSDVAQRYITLSGLMSEGVRIHLGLRGFMMQLRIERCADMQELLALLPEVTAAIAKSRTIDIARDWERVVRTSIT